MDDNREYNQLKKDYQFTFDTKEGKRVFADLNEAYYHRSSYQKNESMSLFLPFCNNFM